jgi:hypothetical protein
MNVVGIALSNFTFSTDGRNSRSFIKGVEIEAKLHVLEDMEKKELIRIESILPSRESSDKFNELTSTIESLKKENGELALKVEQGENVDVKQEKENIIKVIKDLCDIDIDKRKGLVTIVSDLIDTLTEKNPQDSETHSEESNEEDSE